MPHRPRARGAVALPRRLPRLRAADDRRRLAGRARSTKGYDAPEPEPEGDDVAALLDAAEDIVNSAAPDILQRVRTKNRSAGSASARSASSGGAWIRSDAPGAGAREHLALLRHLAPRHRVAVAARWPAEASAARAGDR